MPGRWLAEARRDYYRRRAREEGFRSRAAYKLLEAVERFRLIRRGDIVVELGAWPGGMSQAASRVVGPQGLVIAVDRREFRSFEESNIVALQLDILEDEVIDPILDLTGGKMVDVLVSDASPRFIGVRDVDVARQIELTLRSMEIAEGIVRRGGNVMLKAFECEDLREVEARLREMFGKVRRFIPRSSRKTSSELYLIGLGRL